MLSKATGYVSHHGYLSVEKLHEQMLNTLLLAENVFIAIVIIR